MGTWIRVKVVIPGIHFWPKAPTHRKYLSKEHRHLFFIFAAAPIEESRKIEFFDLQEKTERILFKIWSERPGTVFRRERFIDFGTDSCEDIAKKILEEMPELDAVEVSEDKENAALVYREEE